MDPIRTRWHRVKQVLDTDRVFLSTFADDDTNQQQAEPIDQLPGVVNRAGLDSFFEIFESAPKYFIEKDCLDTIYQRPEQVYRSLEAMALADVVRLPFPYMLVEYDWGGPTLLGLSESKTDPECPVRVTALQLIDTGRGEAVLLSPQTFYVSPVFRDEEDHLTMRWKTWLAGWCWRTPDARRYANGTIAYWKPMVEPGLIASMLLLNTRGLERVLVQPGERFNKARAKKGKHPVPEHTVIRIGHYYTRSNQAVKYEPNHPTRKQPLHLRAGYTAVRWITKAHPKWDASRADDRGKHSHLVYVEPYLVNYDPLSDDLPEIPERVVRW